LLQDNEVVRLIRQRLDPATRLLASAPILEGLVERIVIVQSLLLKVCRLLPEIVCARRTPFPHVEQHEPCRGRRDDDGEPQRDCHGHRRPAQNPIFVLQVRDGDRPRRWLGVTRRLSGFLDGSLYCIGCLYCDMEGHRQKEIH
jgi:hypothetical protein